jgi:hypothetical protein
VDLGFSKRDEEEREGLRRKIEGEVCVRKYDQMGRLLT